MSEGKEKAKESVARLRLVAGSGSGVPAQQTSARAAVMAVEAEMAKLEDAVGSLTAEDGLRHHLALGAVADMRKALGEVTRTLLVEEMKALAAGDVLKAVLSRLGAIEVPARAMKAISEGFSLEIQADDKMVQARVVAKKPRLVLLSGALPTGVV